MNNRLTFVQLRAENKKDCTAFEQLMRPYTQELDEHANRSTPSHFIEKWIQSIIQIQGDCDRHLELCYDNKTLIGFLYGKVDHPDHKGFIKAGYGYVMEFFVLPAFRRNGYGKEMALHLEKQFRQDGVKRMYLTADPVTGQPFWEAMGFVKTGETSPENHLDIYEKQIPHFNTVALKDDMNHLVFVCNLLTSPSNVSALHLKEIAENEHSRFYQEMKEAFIRNTEEDEHNFIIRKGVVPIAWLKLNGFSNDSLWISMLIVHKKYRNLGAGTFALQYAEKFALSTGRQHIYLHTTQDNISAQSLYQKAGFKIVEETNYVNEDNTNLVRYTFHKKISFC